MLFLYNYNMEIKLKDYTIPVVIKRKKSNKHTYLRFKDDLTLYVSTNYLTPKSAIIDLINDKQARILKMYEHELNKQNYLKQNYYLGQSFNIINTNNETTYVNGTLFLNNNESLDDWYLREAKVIFMARLKHYHQNFSIKLPKVKLNIKDLKSQWGNCHVKKNIITLNLQLIKKDLKAIDYVIVHELAHLKYPNHSKMFWNLVSNNFEDYDQYRKYLNSYKETI